MGRLIAVPPIISRKLDLPTLVKILNGDQRQPCFQLNSEGVSAFLFGKVPAIFPSLLMNQR